MGQEKVKPFNETEIQQRRNQKSELQVIRIEVAAAGDMAYEFSNFTLSWDIADTKEHVKFTGSALRVWKKVDAKWQVAAVFQRPHDVPFAQRTPQ
jgi:ketosteroid isomerase-like protein